MSLRITGAADAEIPLRLNIGNQLTRMTVLARQWKFRMFRNIPPQCENIFYLLFLQLCNHRCHFFPRGGSAGQVRQRRNVIYIPDLVGQLHCVIRSSARRPVGDAHVSGL